MNSDLWRNLHGASTHFPIALLLTATALDSLAFIIPTEERRNRLRAASYWMLIVGALGAFPVVISGLTLSRWNAAGQGLLWKHHLFVWPSFGFLLALAVWRVVVGEAASRRGLVICTAAMWLASGLIAAAGYWGGELARLG